MSEFWQSFCDVSNISKPVLSTVIITLVLCIIFIALSFKIKKVDPLKKTPLWLVPFQMIVGMINNFVKQNIGKRWKSYSPWFLSITIFIFFSNISAVFLLENPTSYIMITMALALTSFFVIQLTGIVSNGFLGYLKGFISPNPIMLPMNIVSEISLPISLCLRLFGNIISGSVIAVLIKGFLGYFAIPVMPAINVIFDIGFGIIQTAVFVVLSIIFTSMKVKDEEKIF
ncbi:MAG: F0F1 ATP synthase subunit A [Anaeroplasmataceae bacterium]|nr:F0F1 ATP synthase subunit A [Anaeroplasmataceae bacterium]MDE5867736.1 F0F1 ATP synthase subunit A [Anaeroplasmataceae bacterium]